MSYSLKYDGVTKTLAEWGITGLTVKLTDLGDDHAMITIDGENLSADLTFEPYEEVQIKEGTTVRFTGYITDVPEDGDGAGQAKTYKASGIWWVLSEQEFQVAWTVRSAGVLVQTDIPHIALNRYTTGGNGTVVQQIDAVLDFAIAKGRPIAKGNILPAENVYPPVDEVRDVTCLEVLKKELRWCPNAVSWVDYSTTPPTIHIRRSTDLSAVTLRYGTGVLAGGSHDVTGVSLRGRYDLQRPAVVINYEIVSELDGVAVPDLRRDAFPLASTGSEFRALLMSYDMRGPSTTTVSGLLVAEVCEALSANATTQANWFKAFIPDLRNAAITDLTVLSASRELDNATYPNVLLEGNWASWMTFNDDPVLAARDKLTARVKFNIRNASNEIVQGDVEMEVSYDFIATNAPAGETTYEAVQSFTDGDPVPPISSVGQRGLAQDLYEAMQILQWEGSMALTQAVPAFSVKPGNRVNIIGGKAAWETMNAVVRSVVINLLNGESKIEVGPMQHLGPNDLIDLLRVSRPRRHWTMPKQQFDGDLGASNRVEIGEITAGENTGANKVDSNYRMFKATNSKIVLDATTKKATVEDTQATGGKIETDAGQKKHVVTDKTSGGAVITSDAGNSKHELVKGSAYVTGEIVSGAGKLTIYKDATNNVVIDTASCAGKTLSIVQIKGCDDSTGEDRYMLVIGSGWSATPII